MSKTFIAAIAALALPLAVATALPAAAKVTYSFNRPGVGSFVVSEPTFISGFVAIAPADLVSCTSSFGPCGYQSLFSTGDNFGRPNNAVVIFRDDLTLVDYFAKGALQHPGTYTEALLGNGATLTVSAPEPGAFALLAGGAALAAAARRRTR